MWYGEVWGGYVRGEVRLKREEGERRGEERRGEERRGKKGRGEERNSNIYY